jgi:predicted dehydrogenase
MPSIGVIGLGVMGQRMLASLRAHEGYRIAAAWDPMPDARGRLAETDPTIPLADNAAALFATEGLDAVYIASPPRSHVGYVHQAFDAGRAVLCEKPLGVDAAESTALVERAKAERQRAAVNFPFASSIAATRLGTELATLGPIRSIDIEVGFLAWPRRWQEAAAPWLARRAEGGFVREVVSHFLFLARRLGGPLEIVEHRVEYPPDGEGAETAIEARLMAGTVPVRLSGAVGRTTEIDENKCTVEIAEKAFRIRNWTGLEQPLGGAWHAVDLGPGDPRQRAARVQLDGLAALIEGRPNKLPTLAEGLDVQLTIETLLSQR